MADLQAGGQRRVVEGVVVERPPALRRRGPLPARAQPPPLNPLAGRLFSRRAGAVPALSAVSSGAGARTCSRNLSSLSPPNAPQPQLPVPTARAAS